MTTEEVRKAQRKLDKAARKLREAQEDEARARQFARDDAKPVEPRSSQGMTVVTFTKVFASNPSKRYTYAALRTGVAGPWFLTTGSSNRRGPYTWAQLLDFIAPERDKTRDPAEAWATIREHVATTTPLRTRAQQREGSATAVDTNGPLIPWGI